MSRRKDRNQIIAGLMKSRNLRARVDAHCCGCIYDEAEPGTWRQQVESCSVHDCPIWDVRTRSRADTQL